MPSSFGGLTRFKEEYPSKFRMSPAQVILFVIFVIAFVAALRIFWPIKIVTSAFLSLL